MNQLADDCFNQVGNLMSTKEALTILENIITTVTSDKLENVPLAQSSGRIIAQDVFSDHDIPPHNNSAVDGYALNHKHLMLDGPSRLKIIGRSAAGQPYKNFIQPNQAVRIFTGALMPEGTDTVVMQEDAVRSQDYISVPSGLALGANRRKKGEDTKQGDIILNCGHRLRPQDLGLAASIGRSHLTAYRRLRVAIFSTGDELVEPGNILAKGTIYDANRYILTALMENLGIEVSDLGILPDNKPKVFTSLKRAAAKHDLLMTSGGVSVGEEDHVRDVVKKLGNLHFWRLAIKPGRPLALGQIGTTPFVGLPGNPVAAMVCFIRFARPLILGLAGAVDFTPTLYRVTSDFNYTKKAGRREWLRARLEGRQNSGPIASLFQQQGSGIINSLVQTDGLVEIAENVTAIKAGDKVDFLPFNEVAS